MQRSQEEASEFLRTAGFIWHQRFQIAPDVWTPGTSPVDAYFEMGEVAADLSGASVLDIGTSNGGSAFEAERRGAEHVVAMDIYPPDWFGFDSLKDFLGSRAQHVKGTVYDLIGALGAGHFDFVIFLGVLYHLRHPLLALDNVWSMLAPDGEALIETAVADHELGSAAQLPVARFYRRDELGNDPSNWFAPTIVTLLDWCASAGFQTKLQRAWPPEQPQRCLVKATRSAEGREFESLSYEYPLRGTPLSS